MRFARCFGPMIKSIPKGIEIANQRSVIFLATPLAALIIAIAPTPVAAAPAGAAPAADGGKTTVAAAAPGDTAAARDPTEPAAGTPTAATATSEPAAPTERYPRAVI